MRQRLDSVRWVETALRVSYGLRTPLGAPHEDSLCVVRRGEVARALGTPLGATQSVVRPYANLTCMVEWQTR